MKIIRGENRVFHNRKWLPAQAIILAGLFFALLPAAHAVAPSPGGPGSGSGPYYVPLDSWSFHDPTNWTSDHGYAPMSFTNLAHSHLGNGSSLVVSSTNPASLQYNVFEADGATNLSVNAGTVTFWFAPSWSGTNNGGTGPGVFGRLLEVGGYTPGSSFGWWSIYVDDTGGNIYFSAQTNDLSSSVTTYLSAPISWTTNYFHFVALTYSHTNTALYLDGGMVTNGSPLAVYPGAAVLANGFFIGSDSNGLNQADGLFNNVVTYNASLDSGTIQQIFNREYMYDMMNPYNTAMFRFAPGGSSSNNLAHPSFSPSYFNVISGAGYLQYLGGSGSCITSSQVWMTNVSASLVSQPITFNFSIAGGNLRLDI